MHHKIVFFAIILKLYVKGKSMTLLNVYLNTTHPYFLIVAIVLVMIVLTNVIYKKAKKEDVNILASTIFILLVIFASIPFTI